MNRWVSLGVRQLFGGARRGQPGVAGFGAALAIYGWLRNRNHDNELIYRRKLKPGEQIRIRLRKGDDGADEISITG